MANLPGSRPEGDRAWEALAEARRRNAEAIRALRIAGAELELLAHGARGGDGGERFSLYSAVEAAGASAGLEAIDRMQRQARRELRIIDMPPYQGTPERYAAQEVLQAGRMAAGVAYRVIYSRAACDDPVAGPNMVRSVERGEQARTLADPPMKLVLADDSLAALPLPNESTVLLVRPSALLDALTRTFETLWRLAIPVSADEAAPLDERDRLILTLLASGATDDAIARRVGVNRRTVVRRVSALQARLGATTRFQAGLQAGRRGWL